ncbi:hypothetical protein Tco_0193878 [Tanacetum coccineum]
MTDEDVPAPIPTKSDDQILPFAAWVPIGHSLLLPQFQLSTFNNSGTRLRMWIKLGLTDFSWMKTGDVIIDFVNELGYPECLTGKTSGHDRPRYPVLQMIWGIITNTDKANLVSPTKKGRKDKPHVIPYCRFTKLIIYYLGRIHNIHQRSISPFHLAEENLRLSNLKFVSKGEIDKVFGMPIPNELISNNIRNTSYYNAYLEMVAKHDQKVATEKEGKKKSASTKQSKPKPAIEKSSKPAPALKPKVTKEKSSKASTAKPPKPKPAKEKSTKDTPLQKAGKGKVAKVRNVKSTFQLVDEPDEKPAHSEPEPVPEQEGAGEEYDMECAIQMSLESFQAQGHAHVRGVSIQEPAAEAIRQLPVVEGKGNAITPTTKEASTGPSVQPLDDISANIIRDSPSPANAETEDVEKQENVEENMVELDQDQARSNPGETLVSRPQPEQVHMEEDQARPDLEISSVALAGPDPEPTYDELMADLYPKNLEDAYAIRDQFINDKSTDDEPVKLNVDAEVVSMVTVLIYQASSSVPPLSTPFAERATALKKKLSNLEQTNKNLDNTTRNLRSRVYTLELRDLPHKINEVVCENVKEAVQIALQAPFRDRFRDSPEEDMKEMIHQRMFESGTYKSLPEHTALYEALEPLTPQSSAWKKSDTRDAPSSSSKQQFSPHDKQPVEDMSIPYSTNISDSEDTATTYQALTENSLLAKTGDIRTFMNWYCQNMGKIKLTQVDLEGQAYEVANPEGDQVRNDISKPLPLSGPPGHVTIQTQFFFNHDLDNLRYGSKGSGQALSISKMKAAYYHDFGLELLVPEHMWIDDLCTYDISASYGISYWWFNGQKFYIYRHTVESSRKVVKTHMRILSVVRLKAYSRYGYDYLKDITLRRADHQEYMIAKKDFKKLYPSDFEDLNLLLLQCHLNHLPGSDIFVFPVSNNERKIMRFNEIYKFSDGTLTNIMEALDYRVKEYKRYKVGKVRSDTYTRNPVKEILLKIESTRSQVQVKMEMEIPCSSGVYFITAYSYSTDTSNDLMKAQMSPPQDGKRPKVDDQRLELADDLKEAQDHISSTITSHKTKITTSMYKISHEESKTTS